MVKVFFFIYFMISILILGFVGGFVVAESQLPPYQILINGWNTAKTLYQKQKLQWDPRPYHMYPAGFDEEGVVVYDRDKAFDGVTLITGPWKNEQDWHLGLRLIDMEGNSLHEWNANPRNIWDKSPHHDYATGTKDEKTETNIHGALLLPNGDVVFNLEYYGLVRLNSKSEVVWKLPYRTHHSIYQDNQGNYWVCGAKFHDKPIQEYIGLTPPFTEDTILQVSPDGEILREISVLKVIYDSGYEGLLRFTTDDLLHINNVEVLEEDKALAFTGSFEAGDIMVSLREINTVFVIDGKTEKVKWSITHPLMAHHDPDFTHDGYITIFDNHTGFKGRPYKVFGSRILRIEPLTKEVTTLYGWTEDQYFFTKIGGKHEWLPNGNMIIAEVTAGRIFEITKEGEIVWSWVVPRWDDDSVAEMMEGARYSRDYLNFI